MVDARPEVNPLRVLRESYGLNRKEFCDATGVRYVYLSNMEVGRVRATPTALAPLAQFGIDVDDLVSRNDEWLVGVRESAAAGLRAKMRGGVADGRCEPVPEAD